jgi:enoyl-CoA hydratase
VILTGVGEKAFVAGADIAELARMGPVDGIEVSRLGQQVFRRIELSKKPVIAAVNGFALGGGCELALACHLRIASENAVMGLPETSLGIIPGYGGTQRLARLIGQGRALELILAGRHRTLKAEEAERLGVVNRVVPRERLVDEAVALAAKILENGPIAVAAALEAVETGLSMTLEQGLRFESALFGFMASTSDTREGLTAFLEKRPPRFQKK